MPAFEAIASTKLTVDTATVTFSSIPSTYEHLQLRVFGIAVGAASTSGFIRFNNQSTTGNYWEHEFGGNGTTKLSGGSQSNKITVGRVAGDSYLTTGGVIITDILDYASGNKYKTVRSLSGWDANGAGEVYLRSGSGVFGTAAINRIDFFLDSNMKAGTVVSLYGLRSA
jgi:hypothetical protein